jgi:hypothetical protein
MPRVRGRQPLDHRKTVHFLKIPAQAGHERRGNEDDLEDRHLSFILPAPRRGCQSSVKVVFRIE